MGLLELPAHPAFLFFVYFIKHCLYHQAILLLLTSIWLITLSHCPFCMSPNSNLLIYLFFPLFLSVLLLVAVTNFRYLFFSFSDATRGSAVKRFSISFARHPTNGTFCFYFKRYSLLHPFLFFLISKCGICSIIISLSLISIGIRLHRIIYPKY